VDALHAAHVNHVLNGRTFRQTTIVELISPLAGHITDNHLPELKKEKPPISAAFFMTCESQRTPLCQAKTA
jgi:hypothetical protein